MSLFGEKKTVHLGVEGMTCGHCVQSVEKALKGVAGVRSANVDLQKGEAVVVADAGTEPDALVAAVKDAGYDAEDRAAAPSA